MITILSNVTFIGNEAFHKTSGITMIHVLQEDEKSYGKELFKASEYGLHKCITVFQNYETKHTYQSSENNSYKNAISIVYTLHYADMKSEKKLRKNLSMSHVMTMAAGSLIQTTHCQIQVQMRLLAIRQDRFITIRY